MPKKSKISIIRYDENYFEEKEAISAADLRGEKNGPGKVWINVEKLEDDLVKQTTPVKLQAIHNLKRELIFFR